MRGFQPGKARAVPQNYADGGVVSTIKGMLGFGGGKKKPEQLPADLNKMPPTGAGPAASQPEPPKKAISQYSGMSALERRMKEQGLADGGLVRGLADAVRPFSESVGGYWSNSNKEFEATNPGVGGRVVRAVNPVTGLGSAVGAMYDAAGNGSARDAAIAAVQAAPMFAAMKVVPAAKSLLPTAPQVAAAVGKTASKVTSGTGAGVVADEAQARGFANGGLVRGPGTGISDDIEDEVEEGTFVMPADSTEAIGPEVMDQAGKAVPVNLSNGEAKLPPEALQAIGAQVMEAIKDVTHVPAAKQARGFPMGEHAGPALDADDGRMNFADGGVVDDKRRPRTVADLARSPGYGAGAGGPVSTPVRPQAPAARPQAAQPVPGVTRQGNSYSAAPVQGPLGSGMYQLDSNLPKPPNIQAQTQRPAAAPAQRQPPPAPVQAVQQPAQNPVRPRPVYTGSTVADRARQSGFGFAAGASTPAPPAQAAKVAPAAPVSQRVATPPSAQPSAPAQQPAKANTDTGVGKAFDAIGNGLGWLGKTLVSAPGHGLSNVVGQQPREVGGGRGFMNPGRVNPAAPAPAAPAADPAVTPAADPAAPPQKPEVKAPTAPAPGPLEVSPGVFRQGNSFGDSAAAATAGAQPSQGPSARDMQAMNNLIARDPVAGAMDRALGVERDPAQAATGFSQGGARQAPAAAPASAAASSAAPAATTASGFQPAGQSAQPGGSPMEMYARQAEAMRGLTEAQRALDQYGPGMSGGGDLALGGRASAQQFQQDMLRTNLAKQAAQGGRGGAAAMQALNSMEGNQIQRETAQMREQGDTARFNAREQGETMRAGMRESGENARSGRRDGLAAELGRGQLDLQRSAQGFTTRQGERQEKLYAEYEAAKTPEEQAAVARKIATLSGKEQPADWKVQVTPQTKNVDGSTTEGSVIRYNSRTGDVQRVDGGQGAQAAPAPADPKERKVGTVYVAPNGANVRWTGQGWQQA